MKSAAVLLSLFTLLCSAETKLGKELGQRQPLAVTQLIARADKHVGETVQVKGRVTEVCQMMGCWINLVDPDSGAAVRIKVTDGEIVFPKDAAGRMAIAEGTLKKMELSREQVVAAMRHEAEEQGRQCDPATVKSGKTIYQIQGTGAVLLD